MHQTGAGSITPSYSPTRRTAIILVGEGTAVAYLAGALAALEAAGARMDLLLGKGAGAVVACFHSLHAGDKLTGEDGLLEALGRSNPWRLRRTYLAALACLAISFGAFLSPAVVGILMLLSLPLVALGRVLLPDTTASWSVGAERWLVDRLAGAEPLYFRAISVPLIVLFALALILVVRSLVTRSSFRGSVVGLANGLFELSPLAALIESGLWAAVKGASAGGRPSKRSDLGKKYRDLLEANLGQRGFRELLFYALDLDAGQEVPFAFLKERFRSAFDRRGPGRGAIVAEPVELAGDGARLLFGGLMASVSPPALTPAVPLQLPLGGKFGGEVHRFCSGLSMGQGAVEDAIAAGAEQIIYVSAVPSGERATESLLERLSDASVRRELEHDLRWAERHPQVPVFLVRPDRPRLGVMEFGGRRLQGGERLTLGALLAHGQRDAERLFINPLLAGSPLAPRPPEEIASERLWHEGPQEL